MTAAALPSTGKAQNSRQSLILVPGISAPPRIFVQVHVIRAESSTTEGASNIRILSADQSRLLLDVHRQLSVSLGRFALARRCATLLADIFKAKAAFVSRRVGTWVVLAESAPVPRLPTIDISTDAFERAVEAMDAGPCSWTHDGVDWTLVSLKGRSRVPVVLVVEGDWSLSAPTLNRLASTLRPVDRTALRSRQRQAGVAAHRLSRALGRASGLHEVCAVVLDHIVRAVPSRLAALAVPTDEDRLGIIATHGYPVSIVEDVRINSGTGVIGTVYRNGLPLHVADVTRFPGLQRRPRYRTNSFVALPVSAGAEVLGVVCVTDRLDDRPFSQQDLSLLTALIAPAALALAREGARRQAQTFAHAAIVDPVSGLFNRRYFHHRLHEELQRAQRHKMPVALLMIDIDDFKRVNDSFGHLAGDTIIKDVSDILRRSVRVFDICTRYGGEEFAIVMPGSSVDNAISIAERIRQRIEEHRPSQHELSSLRVTVSIGLSVSKDDGSARDLVQRADLALYGAKRSGKNCVSTSIAQ